MKARTLYVRFVTIILAMMIVASILAFGISNLFYQIYLKPYNDQKITKISQNVVSFAKAEDEGNFQLKRYLQNVTKLGYQIYLVDDQGKEMYLGSKFRTENLNHKNISDVLNGKIYHGVAHLPKNYFIIGFFDDTTKNTVGVPFDWNKHTYAMFIRPDTQFQFGEMRIFIAILLFASIGLTIFFVLIGTRYIVKPVRNLTKATNKVAFGNYDVKLDVHRKDEIGTLARSFSKMAVSLKRLEEMRQEFISNVSHEIQSPLTSIQGFSQALRSSKITEEDRNKYLSVIEEETRRLSLMSRQLLMLASLDREQDILEKTTFDLAKHIKQIIHTTEWQWREKDLAIEMELPPTLVYGDKKFLHQVWLNLIQNSIKFTENSGSIYISAQTLANNQTLIIIEDSGRGINPEDLPHIFERYYKADKSRKREENGSGLGLSIVKKIIELHNGTITVQSNAGKGTKFEITLPNL